MHSAAIVVPEQLRRPHRFVAATREAAKGQRPDESGRLNIGRRSGVVYLHVSREQLRRALLIAQAVIAEAERRGWEVKPVEKSYNHQRSCMRRRKDQAARGGAPSEGRPATSGCAGSA